MMARRATGQSLVEFALAIPLLALVLIGLAEFGFVLYAHVQVSNAAREGARAGSLYLGGRFRFTIESKADCWSIREWVTNGFIELQRDADGCPNGGLVPGVQAFGLLSSDQCATLAQVNCWVLAPLQVDGAVIADDADSTTIATKVGKPLTVSVTYRYQMPFSGSLLNILTNPVPITKTVIMRIQNN